ncbi:BgTH12-04768 [Blumeria graminis f. sp. triticale]|uniref:BgTH12-04768 n=1 Tax=Blumeria graminis f. sp. triticale TaxID=1689686 RepID=A0A9W4GBZ0_BLUGR|nr:BgTH12-04768 [Blumeria graminis f. sp. triticale]
MPANHASIPPSEGPTGTTQLPFSRVKRIIAADSEIQIMSNVGAFVITLATEMFIQHLAEQAHLVVKSERKPRRTIQYKDLATAVSNHDNLEFLVDIVPKTVPYKQIKAKKATATTSSSSKAQDHTKQEVDQPSKSIASSMRSDSNKNDKNMDSESREMKDTNNQTCSRSNQLNEESSADLV